MKKIFLDVGGHIGQTLEEVTKPTYRFDEIYFFEPVNEAFKQASARFPNTRIKWCPFGLSDRTGSFTVHGTGMGMSVYAGKSDASTGFTGELVRASDFFQRHIASSDLVVMKLNCEGSETDILNDLIDTGEIHKLDEIMIDFDVRKIPEKAHEEALVLERLKLENFDRFSLAERVMKGKTHQARIANWLLGTPMHAQITTAQRSLWQKLVPR